MTDKQFDNEEINKIIKYYRAYKAVIMVVLLGMGILYFMAIPTGIFVIFSKLASYYVSKGNYIKAENTYKQSIKIVRKIERKNSKLTICTMNDLATLYIKERKFTEAENIYDEAIKSMSHFSDLGKITWTAEFLEKKSYMYEMQNKHKEAQYCLNKASLLRESDYLRSLR